MDTGYLAELIAKYSKRTPSSRDNASRARCVLAEPLAPIPFVPSFKEISYPIVATRCEGSHFWDADSNDYLDFCMGCGSTLFGHNPPFLKEALAAQIESGFCVGVAWAQAAEVARLIVRLTGMERVTFACTGTEAVMIALRLARTATCRERIALFSDSFHGQYDGTLAAVDPSVGTPQAVPSTPGISRKALGDVLILPYGSDESLQLISDHRDELAAVLVEPVQTRRPDLRPRTFLHEIRALTMDSGIALIFDELVTGFRLALGGAQAWFDVHADLAIYGKALASGLPIAAVAGTSRFVDPVDGGTWSSGDDSGPHALETFTSSTFAKHPLSLAAARSTLRRMADMGPILQEDLNRTTSQVVASLNQCLEEEELRLRFAACGSYFGPIRPDDDSWSMAIPLLHYALAAEGIYLYGASGFLSTAHTSDELDDLCCKFRETVATLKAAGLSVEQ
jgi:glutamate-1-semialdehyde 2,1-aminomutase